MNNEEANLQRFNTDLGNQTFINKSQSEDQTDVLAVDIGDTVQLKVTDTIVVISDKEVSVTEACTYDYLGFCSDDNNSYLFDKNDISCIIMLESKNKEERTK